MESSNKEQNTERIRLTNIVGETKKEIMDNPGKKSNSPSQPVSDDEIRQAIEKINPDPNSMKNWG